MTFTQISDNYIRSAFSSPHYKLLEKIGEGGFGKVYTAHQINTGQTVAIKFLALDPNGEETQRTRYVERFKRETLLCSKLHHPNIVRLLDQGQCNDNLLFGVFEYVDGQSLRTFLTSNGPMSPLEAQDIMLQLLDALIHAHQHGIIHRDIKPANVMLSKGGARTHAKILDFGIGTLTQDSRHQEFHTLTLTQETLGTPSYSAPEQLRGEPATESTDLYVWGLLFLECLTGIPAVSGSSLASIYHKQLSDAQVPIPQALLGHPVAGLLRRLLHKNPNDRVITGEEAYQELTHMNMASLVGALGTFRAVNLPNESTVILRDDEPNHPLHADYTFFTERKQITVLAVRFSIALIPGSDSDLDVLDALFKSHRGHCLDIATRFGAYHVGSLGDTSLFYFGYPTASDNDARLCARTALEVMSDLAKRNALMKDSQGAILSMHAGIHSGIFTTFANSTPEGHIANAALALARHANSNQILCSREARSLLEPYTEFEGHDDLQLGLTSATEPVFKMVGERRIEAFGFMRGTRNNHELIGRDVELEQTLSMFNGLNQSNHIAHIFGEAGIGKSRLLQEIRKNASGYQHLVAQCLPEHQNNALYPILNLVRYLYNTPQLSSEKAIALFSDILVENTPSLDIENALPILMIWLNIEFGEELTASTLAPDQQKSILFTSLTALLSSKYHSISEKKLYIVEDIHWADTTTLEFVQHFAKTLKQGDVLLNTSRQALPSQLKDLTLLEVGLKKLTEQATKDFIVKLFDEQPVARNVLDVLINRTDGIPLFIEELVDMIKQKELVSVIEGEINFDSPDKLEHVPSSLRESLQQKLDSLVYAKETAQLAATIGREFEYDLLVAASSLSENQIQNDLKELIAKDLIVHQRHINNDSYIFKHALVRDAAYESMDKCNLEQFHDLLGTIMSTVFLNKYIDVPWLISGHFRRANNVLQAVNWSLYHFEKSNNLSMNQQVVDDSETLKTWLKSNSKYLASLETLINHVCIPSFIKKQGWGNHDIYTLAQRNLDYLETFASSDISFVQERMITKDEIEFRAQWTLFIYHHYQGERNTARELGEKVRTHKLYANKRSSRVMLDAMLGQAYFFDGDFSKARLLLQSALDAYDAKLDKELNIAFGFDPYMMSLGNLMSIEAMAGNITQAKELRDKCLLTAKSTGNKAIELTGYTWGTCYFFLVNDRHGMKSWCERATIKSPELFTGEWIQRYFDMNKGWFNRDVEHGLKTIEEDIVTGQVGILAWYIPPLVDSLLAIGRYDEAYNIIMGSYKRSLELGDNCVLAITTRELARAEYFKAGTLSPVVQDRFEESICLALRNESYYLALITMVQLYELTVKVEDRESLLNRIKEVKKHLKPNAEYWFSVV